MRIGWNRIGLFVFGASLVACSSREPAPVVDSRDVASTTTWYLSGYLPEKPDERVWLRILGDRITAIEDKAPPASASVVQTESFVFPGLMDMHGHVKYNVLPLWSEAKSQFVNRFEWRQKYAPYKDATSLNMKPIKGHVTCAAVRWAELKAIAGGATAMQGIGGDGSCAKGYGARNVDLQGEFDARKIRNLVDIIDPGYIRTIYIPYGFEQRMKKGMSYEKAFESFLAEEDFGGGMTVREWFDLFKEERRDLARGLRLLVGDDFNVKAGDVSPTSFRKIQASLADLLGNRYKLSDAKKLEKQLAAMEIFLFGKGTSKGYVQLTGALTDDHAADFLSKGGVLTIPSSVRRFIGMWEWPARRSVQKFFKETSKPVMFVHLSEGRRDDAYNQSEWSYLKRYGLAFPGMILIHGVGMSEREIAEASRMGVSFVWSPFSNLLLYGETLRVDAAVRARANITLGSDWSPTGSKNILDEMRLARAYADQARWKLTDEQIVEMVTINAAKALKIEDRFGRVAPGYTADLTLVARKPGQNPYTALVQSRQEDLNLVVIAGQPVFGDADLMENVAKDLGGANLVERVAEKCSAPKAFRYVWKPEYDTKKSGEGAILKASQIEKLLTATTAQYRATLKSSEQAKIAKLDPLFSCEDAAYTERFESYVSKELPANVRGRTSRRTRDRLATGWSPLVTGATEGSDEDGADAAAEGDL